MATVTVTAILKSVGGIPDNTVFTFRSPVARQADDNSIVTTKWTRVEPVDGVLTAELQTGPCTVSWTGSQPLDIDIPDSDSDLWPLIAVSVGIPPATPQGTLLAAVAAYLADHPVSDWDDIPNKPDVVAAGATAAAVRATVGSQVCASISSLKGIAAVAAALGASDGHVRVLGHASSGDGGGGTFRWDSTDTTSADNGGTIIAPTGALASSGRWKRVYEGEVNARWFGMHPSKTDNTAALQAAVDWVQTDQTRNPSGGFGSGTVFIPMGYYRFTFADLDTITINNNYVLIRGEGPSTMLTVRGHARPDQVDYFFTFSASFKAIGGGVRDLCINGNSMLKWGIYLNTWHAASFENILVTDVHMGSLDAESTLSGNCGENILVHHVDYNSTSSNTTTGCLTQYNIRFRSTAGASWSDCEIRDCMAVGIWDTGVVLDGVIRFNVQKCDVSLNYATPNTVDGTTRHGVMHAVKVTHSVNGTWSSANGQHVIDALYHESHEGSEDAVNYCAVLIESPSGGGGYNRFNRISNINTSWNVPLAPALLRITNDNGVDGQVSQNTFTGNRRPVSHNQITIGAAVRETYLNLTPNLGLLRTIKVYDSGTRTYINGVRNGAYRNSALYPDNTMTASEVDVGEIVRDTVTGRVVWQDQLNDPVLIGPRPGLDVVSPFGAQRIQALATPAAPRVTPTGSGSTTWTYYVVAIDKDGNKTPPSPAGTTTAGPSSLSSSTYNVVQWFPVEGAVKYDLLRGGTSTSIATNLVTPHYNDPGTTTTAYTPSAVSPPGTLTVDGQITASSGLAVPGAATIGGGTGTPEGAVTAPVGSIFLRNNGSSGSCLYVKESGSGNTGWVAAGSGGGGGGTGDAASTPSTLALRDGNANLIADNFIATRASTATAGGTTTLTIADAQVQVFTGTLAQTVKLPTTGVVAGQTYVVINNSTVAVTVQSSGANLITALGGGKSGIFTAKIDTPAAAADWFLVYGQGTTATSPYTTVLRDANANITTGNFISLPTSTPTAAGTTTLTVTSTAVQVFTGTTTQTVLLPTTSIVAGQLCRIVNQSTGIVTVQSSAANVVGTVTPGTTLDFVASVATPTTAAHWQVVPTITGAQRIAVVTTIPGSPDPNTVYIVNDAGAPRVTTITSSATPAINTDACDAVTITALAAAITSMTTSLTGTPHNFQKLMIRIKDNGTARAIAWGASFEAGTVALPTTTVVGKTLLVGLVYDAVDAKWACEATGSRA